MILQMRETITLAGSVLFFFSFFFQSALNFFEQRCCYAMQNFTNGCGQRCNFPSEWASCKPQRLFFFSSFLRVTLGFSFVFAWDRLIDLCAIWDAGVYLPSAACNRASSGVARKRLNEAEKVSRTWAWGMCHWRGESEGTFLPPAPSLR